MHDISLGEALHQMLHAYRRAMGDAYREARIDLAIPQIRSLKVIRHYQEAQQGSCTAQIIASSLECDKGQVARVVKGLLAAQLIEKRDNPHDGRSQFLQLTGPGFEMLDRIRDAEHRASLRMARGLGESDVKSFIRLAGTMTENLKQ